MLLPLEAGRQSLEYMGNLAPDDAGKTLPRYGTGLCLAGCGRPVDILLAADPYVPAGQSWCAVRPKPGGYKAMSPALVGLNPQLPK